MPQAIANSLENHSSRKGGQNGFNLIELMITIFIVSILLVIAVPSFQETIQSNRMTSVTNELVGALNFARSEAIRRGDDVHFGSVPAGVNPALPGVEWVAWTDTNGNSDWDAGEEVRVWQTIDPSMTLTAATAVSFFVFNASGFLSGGTSNTLTLCDDRTGETGRTVDILVSGAIFVEKITCS